MARAMAAMAACVLVLLLAGVSDAAVQMQRKEWRHEVNESGFLLEDPIRVVDSEAGEINVWGLPHAHEVLHDQKLTAGQITLEPRALLLPHYTNAAELSIIVQGKGKLTIIWKGKAYEEDVKEGDVFGIPPGVVWYLLNRDPSQRLRTFSVADVPMGHDFQNLKGFFVVGGSGQQSTVLNGFSERLLARAFDVPRKNISELLSFRGNGPIVFLSSDQFDRLASPAKQGWISWLGMAEETKITYNFEDEKKPDFKNDGGWSTSVDKKKLKFLKLTGLGALAVKLEPGALLAPHWNPLATEVSIVTRGSGFIEVSYPNGTAALRVAVEVGDVFVIPRFYPVAQVASRDYGLEFVGVTTSDKPSMPQFLSGQNSVMKGIEPEILAAAFDIPVKVAKRFVDAQKESVIIPHANDTAPDELQRFVKDLPRFIRGVPVNVA